jgi:Bacterial tandem repeat domain 1
MANTISLRSTLSALALLVATSLSPAHATNVSELTGVWQEGGDPYYLWVGVDWQGFTAKWKELSNQGLRLVDIEPFTEDGKLLYAGVWRSGNDGHFLWKAADWKSFTAKWKELGEKKLRLMDVETFVEGGKRGFLGVWREGSDGYALWAAPSWQTFTEKWKELSKNGQRLIDIEAYDQAGATHYVGVFRAGSGGHFLWKADSWKDFTAKWNELDKKNLKLIDYERIAEGGAFKYVGVFRSGAGGQALWRSEPEAFLDKWEELGAKNLRLVDLELTISGGKPVPPAVGSPKPVSECRDIGPFRFEGSRIKGIAYGENYEGTNLTKDSVFQEPNAVVKLVGGVCVQEGEVEYTLHYRTSAWRPLPIVQTLKAGQCSCHWNTKTTGWPFELAVLSTAKVKSAKARYTHKLSVCYTPWCWRCDVHTSDGWK